MVALAEAYPLTWPLGSPRTPLPKRRRARFSSMGRPLSIAAALSRLKCELRRLDATSIVISSNIPVRKDGLPYSTVREPDDSGVAVYFRIKDRTLVFPCDRWDRVADCIGAIASHLDALRAQARYGVGERDQAYVGYAALGAMPAELPWCVTLGFPAPPLAHSEVAARVRELARLHHPDRGGSDERMSAINAAATEARTYFDQRGHAV